MINLENLTSLDSLKYVNHESVANFTEGQEKAIAFFNEMYSEDEDYDETQVVISSPKKIYDEKNSDSHVLVYESYVDSGSEDYFYFSFPSND